MWAEVAYWSQWGKRTLCSIVVCTWGLMTRLVDTYVLKQTKEHNYNNRENFRTLVTSVILDDH